MKDQGGTGRAEGFGESTVDTILLDNKIATYFAYAKLKYVNELTRYEITLDGLVPLTVFGMRYTCMENFQFYKLTFVNQSNQHVYKFANGSVWYQLKDRAEPAGQANYEKTGWTRWWVSGTEKTWTKVGKDIDVELTKNTDITDHKVHKIIISVNEKLVQDPLPESSKTFWQHSGNTNAIDADPLNGGHRMYLFNIELNNNSTYDSIKNNRFWDANSSATNNPKDVIFKYNPPLNETIWKDDKQVTPDGFYTKYYGDLYISKKLLYDGSLDTPYSFNNTHTIRNMTDRRILPYYNKNGKNGYRLYTIKPENIKEYAAVNDIYGKPVYKHDSSVFIPNDDILQPTIGKFNCRMQYSDFQRLDVTEEGNKWPYGYLRFVVQSTSKDEPMYLNPELTIPCLTIEQKGENDMYGFIPALRYVYSNKSKFIKDEIPQYYGNNIVTKMFNLYFSHELDLAKPYEFKYGIYITPKPNSDKFSAIYGTQSQDLTMLLNNNSDYDLVLNIIVNRAKNFCNYIEKSANQHSTNDNITEVFDILNRGDIQTRDSNAFYHNVGKYETLGLANKKYNNGILQNIHIKLGQILIITKKTLIDNKLINNGIIIIKDSGELNISNNGTAQLINNGFIIRLNGGVLTEQNVSHHSNLSKQMIPDTTVVSGHAIIYNENDIRKLKDHLHHILVPSQTKNMVLGLDIDYQKTNTLGTATEIFSKQSSLFISSNSTDVTIPKWDNRKKTLSFDMVSPSESYDGILTNKFFTMYIPDYLIEKWWKISRSEVENNLGTQNGIKLFRTDTNTGQQVSIPIETNKITNDAMRGLYISMDLVNGTVTTGQYV